MKNSSTYRILYLLNLLDKKDYTKNEIINEFSKTGENVSKTSINCYINKLIKNGFNIKILNDKNTNIYHLEAPEITTEPDEIELKCLREIKKILTAQKDYDKIRKFIRILYKFVLNIKNEEIAHKFFNFGYYSKINWGLVRNLEQHCKNKDLIEIDYVLTSGENKKIAICAHELKISDWSDRLYLWGMFENSDQLSYLPVDRIFMINKVKQKSLKPKTENDYIIYIISKTMYEESEVDENEKVIKITDKFVTVKRELKGEFYIIQRLMSFCPDLYYISNERIKNIVKEKLTQINSFYERAYE